MAGEKDSSYYLYAVQLENLETWVFSYISLVIHNH